MTLVANLDRPLPAAIPVGRATAVFCIGICFHPEQRIEHLEILVDETRHRPAASGMPRPDAVVPGGHFGGFWATVPVPAQNERRTVHFEVEARLASGARMSHSLGEIEVVSAESPPPLEATPSRPGPGLIAVCMATFEPDLSLFEAQVESLRRQSDDRWICLISDDCTSPERYAQMRRVVGDDSRFAISRSEQRLGFYRNFERALRTVPLEAEFVALCDHDDRWYPEKLQVLRDRLGDAVLVYSDQRLVDADGAVLRETLWQGRRNNYDSLASMLVANTITGAAMLFRRDLLEIALPFPDTPGFQFHDHWLAVAALAAGDVAYVDRPLYDYVQHAGAVFGDVTHGARSRVPRGTWRAAYFYGYLAREVQARALLMRCGSRLTGRKRRDLERFCACDSSLRALAWLGFRPLRRLFGRTETLGTEIELAQGIVWKRLATTRARWWRRPGGPLADSGFPPPETFIQRRLREWRSRL